MKYTVVSREQLPQVEELWDYCFEKRQEPFFQYYFTQYCCQQNIVMGAFDEEEQLKSMVHVNPYRLRVRGAEQLVPYLVGVATAPEARGAHIVKPLLQTTLASLRAQGVNFVTLMPIFAGIYLPYEFSYCYYRHAYKLPLASLTLPRADARLTVKRVPLAAELLAPLYASCLRDINGVPVRSDEQWQKLLTVHAQEGVLCAVCQREGANVGYMLYTISAGVFHVHELLAEDAQAKNRLLQFAATHQSSAQELSWLAEPWDKTYLHFNDQSVTGSVAPFMMARCLNVKLALEQLENVSAALKGSVVLQVTDKLLGGVTLEVQLADGRVQAQAVQAVPDVAMGVGAFTQLYFGTFSADELREAGLIDCRDTEKLQLLDEFLPKARTYVNEYF